jgi:EAL domain-containing protein (putative c-di-GMP-specific phosphodiesterase class I)
VTESLLTDAVGAENVRRLGSLGVGIALDDYGTGFSSLGQLKRVPVDVVKIDRAFVAGLTTDRVDAAIVASTINLAHALGKGVVAEGVETAEQLDILRSCGCDTAQGHLFARPAPADVVAARLRGGWTWPDGVPLGTAASVLDGEGE